LHSLLQISSERCAIYLASDLALSFQRRLQHVSTDLAEGMPSRLVGGGPTADSPCLEFLRSIEPPRSLVENRKTRGCSLCTDRSTLLLQADSPGKKSAFLLVSGLGCRGPTQLRISNFAFICISGESLHRGAVAHHHPEVKYASAGPATISILLRLNQFWVSTLLFVEMVHLRLSCMHSDNGWIFLICRNRRLWFIPGITSSSLCKNTLLETLLKPHHRHENLASVNLRL